jgi:hypothetical protein
LKLTATSIPALTHAEAYSSTSGDSPAMKTRCFASVPRRLFIPVKSLTGLAAERSGFHHAPLNRVGAEAGLVKKLLVDGFRHGVIYVDPD